MKERIYRKDDVFLADLGIPHGSEQGGRRPVVIVQTDGGCIYLPTVKMVPMTTAIKKPYLKTHYLDSRIDFGTYQDKKSELTKEQQLKTTELKQLQGEASVEKDLHKRIDAMRKMLTEAPVLKKCDRHVFESIVEKVIVGGYDEAGNADPSMITFVYKTGFEDKKKGGDFEPERRNAASKKLSSLAPDDSGKLESQSTDVSCGVAGLDIFETGLS